VAEVEAVAEVEPEGVAGEGIVEDVDVGDSASEAVPEGVEDVDGVVRVADIDTVAEVEPEGVAGEGTVKDVVVAGDCAPEAVPEGRKEDVVDVGVADIDTVADAEPEGVAGEGTTKDVVAAADCASEDVDGIALAGNMTAWLLNGHMPVASNSALTVSDVKETSKSTFSIGGKSFFPTGPLWVRANLISIVCHLILTGLNTA
jgi:hypothetical protein